MISQEMTEEMLTKQVNSFTGLGLFIAEKESKIDKHIIFSHDGGDRGFVGRIMAYRDQGKGLAILCNTDFGAPGLIDEIQKSASRLCNWPDYLQNYTILQNDEFADKIVGKYKINNN